MLVKRIAAPIYLQPFTSCSEILAGNCNFFLPLAFNASVGVFPLEFWEKFGPQKTRIMGLRLSGSEDSLTTGRAVSTQYQRVTDRQTDRRPACINNVRSMTDARTLLRCYALSHKEGNHAHDTQWSWSTLTER